MLLKNKNECNCVTISISLLCEFLPHSLTIESRLDEIVMIMKLFSLNNDTERAGTRKRVVFSIRVVGSVAFLIFSCYFHFKIVHV